MGRKILPAEAQRVVVEALKAGKLTEAQLAERGLRFDKEAGKVVPATPPHNCWDDAVPYGSDGALGHGWECGVCGKFLQAG